MYEKHIWETGELITADKLNHLVDGIDEAIITPKLTVTVTSNVDFYIPKNNLELGLLDRPDLLIDGHLCSVTRAREEDFTLVRTGESCTFDIIAPVFIEDGEEVSVVNSSTIIFYADSLIDVTASNEVNCVFDDGAIIITDITKNASISLEYSMTGPLG